MVLQGAFYLPQRRCNNETDNTHTVKVQPVGGWDIENVFKEECIQFYNLSEETRRHGHIVKSINISILVTTHTAKQTNNESKEDEHDIKF